MPTLRLHDGNRERPSPWFARVQVQHICFSLGYYRTHEEAKRVEDEFRRKSLISIHGSCEWEGPDGQVCLLWRGHRLMKVGSGDGHLPDRAVESVKPAARRDGLGD